MIPLYGSTPAELATALGGPSHARLVWRALASGSDPRSLLPAKAARRLAEGTAAEPARVERRSIAADGTQKLLIRFAAGDAVETVLIPARRRTTTCISTQVGCARGCVFCVTATMPALRSLEAGEIVAQVLLGAAEARAAGMPPPSNVVLMGMGEPLDNLDSTLRALEVLTHPQALGLAPGHITLSTVGTSPRAIARLERAPACLAWSVHAADDALRSRLVPTTRHRMAELRDAFVRLMRARGDELFVEVTLMAGVNDGEAHAEALADLLAPLPGTTRVNLLPMNTGRAGLAPATQTSAERFQALLRARGYFCMLRRPRGADAHAACGQLAVAPREERS